MTEFDEMIACIANQVQHSKEIDDACQKTLDDYHCSDVHSATENVSVPLRMIAWDRA